MISVLSCGLPSASVEGARPASLVRYPAGRVGEAGEEPEPLPEPLADPLAELADLVAPRIEEGATIVAIVPDWAAEPAHARLLEVRSALDTTRLVVHRTALPPLAAGALATVVAELAGDPRVTASTLVHRLPEVETRAVAVGWLGSVAGLRHPAPRLRQHLWSLWPRSAFVAVVDEEPRVLTLGGKEDGTLPLPRDADGPWRVAMAIGRGDIALVERSLATHVPNARVVRVPLTAVSREWWGTDTLMELAFCPGDLDAMAGRWAARPLSTRCGWCDKLIGGPTCPFCGLHQPDLTPAAAGGST